jgi:alanyl-tRNA synthetase
LLGPVDTGTELQATEEVSRLVAGDWGWIILEETPFYVQAGGQVSDIGVLHNDFGFHAAVVDVSLMVGGIRLHEVKVQSGEISIGSPVTAQVDVPRRDATRRNHTATHLLHAALRQVLGTHVKQAGSLVAPDRLRFDFVHFSALTREQLAAIEQIVNEQILQNTPVETEVRSTQEAIAAGAIVIDNGSDFRMLPSVPLVVPEVNPDDLKQHQGLIANPNCSTIQMVSAPAPIHRAAQVTRVVVATYQAD